MLYFILLLASSLVFLLLVSVQLFALSYLRHHGWRVPPLLTLLHVVNVVCSLLYVSYSATTIATTGVCSGSNPGSNMVFWAKVSLVNALTILNFAALAMVSNELNVLSQDFNRRKRVRRTRNRAMAIWSAVAAAFNVLELVGIFSGIWPLKLCASVGMRAFFALSYAFLVVYLRLSSKRLSLALGYFMIAPGAGNKKNGGNSRSVSCCAIAKMFGRKKSKTKCKMLRITFMSMIVMCLINLSKDLYLIAALLVFRYNENCKYIYNKCYDHINFTINFCINVHILAFCWQISRNESKFR